MLIIEKRKAYYNCYHCFLTWITCNNVPLLQKREERASAFQKNTKLTDQKKKKWLGVIKNELMSSEESCSDEDTICVRPLPWRSPTVNSMFKTVDRYTAAKKTPQARRQMKKRVNGEPSKRPPPAQGTISSWALVNIAHNTEDGQE